MKGLESVHLNEATKIKGNFNYMKPQKPKWTLTTCLLRKVIKQGLSKYLEGIYDYTDFRETYFLKKFRETYWKSSAEIRKKTVAAFAFLQKHVILMSDENIVCIIFKKKKRKRIGYHIVLRNIPLWTVPWRLWKTDFPFP